MVRDNEDETPPDGATIRWRIADLPDGLMGRKIIYSHGQFIAVGRAANPARDDESYSGAIVTSGDGINWTWRNVDIDNGHPVWMVRKVGLPQTEEPLMPGGTDTFRDPEMFVDNPDGFYLFDGINVFTSKDATNWQVTHSFALPLFDSNYKAVRYNDELLYPQEWAIQSFDATGKRPPLSFDVRGQMDPPVVSPHLLVAIGKSEDPTGKIPPCPAMFTSSDAHLWTAHPEAFRDISPISYLTYGLGSFWVFNNTNDRPASDTTGIYKSIDGIVWNKIARRYWAMASLDQWKCPVESLVADDRGDLLFTRDGVTWQSG